MEQKKKTQERLKDEQIQASKPPAGNNNSRFAAQKFEKESYFLVHHIMADMNLRPENESEGEAN